MPRKKKLTRFTVNCDGKERQLLKVRDEGEELTIILVTAHHATDAPFAGAPIVEQRYSVHATRDSPHKINEIKQTFRVEGGGIVETVLDARGPKQDMIQMIFGRLCPYLSPERYDFESRPRDSIVSLGQFNSARRTLVYAVLIGSNDGPTEVAPDPRFKQLSHDFQSFRLHIVWSFISLPSYWEGKLFHSVSTEPRFNKAPVPEKTTPYLDGLTPELAKVFALELFEQFQEVALGFAPQQGFDSVLGAVKKVGFGVWTDDDLRQKLARA